MFEKKKKVESVTFNEMKSAFKEGTKDFKTGWGYAMKGSAGPKKKGNQNPWMNLWK